jgi:hypothetical protein
MHLKTTTADFREINHQQDQNGDANKNIVAVSVPRWSFVNSRQDNSRRECFEPSSSHWRFDTF